MAEGGERLLTTYEEGPRDVANVLAFGMQQAPLPQRVRSVPGDQGHAECYEEPGEPAENRPRPGEGENGETNILSEEEQGGFLPTERSKFDLVVCLLDPKPCDGVGLDVAGLELVPTFGLFRGERGGSMYFACRFLFISTDGRARSAAVTPTIFAVKG